MVLDSLLLENILIEKGQKVFSWDPYVDESYEKVCDKFNWKNPSISHVFFIGTKQLFFNDVFN